MRRFARHTKRLSVVGYGQGARGRVTIGRHGRAGLAVAALAGVFVLVGTPVGSPADALTRTDRLADQTITFTGGGPAACESRPSVPDIVVPRWTRIRLINEIGARARLELGGLRLVMISDGSGVSIQLWEGRHSIRLVPDCDVMGPVGTVVVTVTGRTGSVEPGRSDAPGASPTAPGLPSGGAPTTSTGPGTAPGAGAGPGNSGSARAGPSRPGRPDGGDWANGDWAGGDWAGGGDQGKGPDGRPLLVDGASGALDDLHPFSGTAPAEGDSRLLPVLAAICVFGVTSAIIRVMVMQRASGVVDT